MAGLTRPLPAGEVSDPRRLRSLWIPAPEVWEWALAAFVADGAPLHNPDHRHLRSAHIGVLWTNVRHVKHMRLVVGMMMQPQPPRSPWGLDAIAHARLVEWFGAAPDFVMVLDAPHAAECDDLGFCSLTEHELYHGGHRRNRRTGAPMFTRSGRPVYGLRGHDAEEHVGIVRRYGVDAAAGGVRELVQAAQRPPEIGRAKAAGVCGTCIQMVA